MSFTILFGDTSRTRLLDFLGDHPASHYTIAELAEASGVSPTTVRVELPELQDAGLVDKSGPSGESQLFTLNTDHPVVREVLASDILSVRDEG